MTTACPHSVDDEMEEASGFVEHVITVTSKPHCFLKWLTFGGSQQVSTTTEYLTSDSLFETFQ